MTDLDTIKAMLDRAKIEYEVDEVQERPHVPFGRRPVEAYTELKTCGRFTGGDTSFRFKPDGTLTEIEGGTS